MINCCLTIHTHDKWTSAVLKLYSFYSNEALVQCGVVVPFLGLVVGKTIETSRAPKGGEARRGALWDHLLRFPVRL